MLQTHGYAAQQPSSANGMMRDTKPSSKGRRSSPARRPYPQRRGAGPEGGWVNAQVLRANGGFA